jgi:hypothetical protein
MPDSDTVVDREKELPPVAQPPLNAPDGFPFRSLLDLSPLVDFWRKEGGKGWRKPLLEEIERGLEDAPELLEPITDLAVIDRHRPLVEMLMSAIFPVISWERDCAAALLPFQFQSFYATPSCRQLLMSSDGVIKGRVETNPSAMMFGRTLKAYVFILAMYYGEEIDLDYPFIFIARDQETGLDRHYRINFDPRFLKVRAVAQAKSLTEEEKKRLLANITDLSVWQKLIDPEKFEFHGFAIVHAVDVTDQEVLSGLKRDLIENDSVLSISGFASLQERLRTLLRQPALEIGVAAVEGDEVLALNHSRPAGSDCIFADSYKVSDFPGSIYARAIEERKIQIVDDLEDCPSHSMVEEKIARTGKRSMIVAPLMYQEKVIGALQLSSPNPGDLNTLSVMKLGEVLPLFAMAVKRSAETLNNRVQAVIREQYTAIHPSVEWRFRKAAFRLIQNTSAGSMPEIEPIVFNEVYPLYSMSDIRGSSVQRNASIQADLVEHLRLAREILSLAHDRKPLPFLDDLIYRIDRRIGMVAAGLSSGDEASIVDFLHREVDPLLDHLAELHPVLVAKVASYRDAIDPHLGSIYKKRKEFEESVATINRAISTYLDLEEEKAQRMFPHYSEKHKTDGVDLGIYVGASLVEDGRWSPLYLRNLRLWQFMTLCGVARLGEALKASLKVPLDTTHLILVQNTPLSIRFHLDEKQFDVDGAYNIRYEIMKKRIDKAVIRDTDQRLTQPGKIAVVYAQPSEAAEYREYIDYLRAKGFLTGEAEDLELEELQGVHGLKALRVVVVLEAPAEEHPVTAEEIERAIREITIAD